MDKRTKLKHFLKRLKLWALWAVIAAVILSILASIYSALKPSPVLKNIYMSFYYFGAFALIFAVPQLYKRDEDPKLRRIRTMSPLYGFTNFFNNPYHDQAMIDSFEEFRGEGFWTGILIVIFSLIIFLFGFILENIYMHIGG